MCRLFGLTSGTAPVRAAFWLLDAPDSLAAHTHPFAMGGRIMAHNGGFGELPQLEEQLGSYARAVLGDTDSERYFALITQQTEANRGDVGAGIAAAASWIA
jgi:glutamine amidotransferase